MVTFSNLIESKGRTEGVSGDLSEKMFSVFRRDGSENDGASIGLRGKGTEGGAGGTSGGKSACEKRGWILSTGLETVSTIGQVQVLEDRWIESGGQVLEERRW